MKNHRLYNIWNQVPVTYYQQGIKNNIFQWIWHTHKINIAKKLLKELNFKNCLDVGCASGYMVSEIAKAYLDRKYFGIDVYDKAIEYAKSMYPDIKFLVASADKLPFPSSSFDLIICYETIEHVENPRATLKELRRVLDEDGRLILAMDSGSFLFRIIWFIWEHTKGRVWQGAHLHPFQHNKLERLLSLSGFKIDKKIFSHFGMEIIFILKKGST